MGWQVRKKISFRLMNMRNSKFCGFTTTMDKCHYVMRKVLHNNIDSSRLSQEYDAAKYHSNVGRIEFNRTLMPQFSKFISVRVNKRLALSKIIHKSKL